MREKRKEYYLEVTQVTERGIVIITDRSHMLEWSRFNQREKLIDRVDHIISGKDSKIFIECWGCELGYEQCKRIAIKWFKGDTTRYRLD